MQCSKILMCENGPSLSRVVAGMWRMGEWSMSVSQRLQLIEQCIELGVTTFDHADIYGGGEVELRFGEALANKSELKHKIQIVTKCGIQNANATWVKTNGYNFANTKACINQLTSVTLRITVNKVENK